MSRYFHVILVCVLTCAALAGRSEAQNSSVLAEINGQQLTTDDLDRQGSPALLQARYDYYLAQRKALDAIIEQQLLAAEAARQHLTVDELLQREVNSKVTDPTEDQLRVYYEGLQTSESFDAVRGKVLDHIREMRRDKVRKAYMQELREKAQIVVTLAPPITDAPITGSYVRGRADAPVTIVEFADYQCPYCQGVDPDLEKLRKEFGDKIAITYKDFPLPMHPNAQKAAEAARCAGVQGKFWEFHDLLFREKQLEPAALKQAARTLNLDAARFDKCVDSGEQSQEVKEDYNQAVRLGLSGTPSFFINRHFLSGALDYATLREVVEQQLKGSLSAAHKTSYMDDKPSPKEVSANRCSLK